MTTQIVRTLFILLHVYSSPPLSGPRIEDLSPWSSSPSFRALFTLFVFRLSGRGQRRQDSTSSYAVEAPGRSGLVRSGSHPRQALPARSGRPLVSISSFPTQGGPFFSFVFRLSGCGQRRQDSTSSYAVEAPGRSGLVRSGRPALQCAAQTVPRGSPWLSPQPCLPLGSALLVLPDPRKRRAKPLRPCNHLQRGPGSFLRQPSDLFPQPRPSRPVPVSASGSRRRGCERRCSALRRGALPRRLCGPPSEL